MTLYPHRINRIQELGKETEVVIVFEIPFALVKDDVVHPPFLKG